MRTAMYCILLCLGLGGCSDFAHEMAEAHVTVMVDRSDTTISEVTMHDLRIFLEADGQEFASLHFRVRRLAESTTDTAREAHLEGWSGLRQNTEITSRRKKERADFFLTAEELLAFPYAAPSSHTSIIRPLVEELASLSSRKGQRNVVLASDLAENTPTWSAYDRGSGLWGDLDTLAARLGERFGIVGDFTDITLWVLHRPKGQAEVQRFERLVLLYRKMFEPRGLIVKPVANLY